MTTTPKQDSGNSLDLVDIKEIKGGVVVMKDGSMRQIVMVGGVNFSLKSDTEQNIITQAYQNFLNGIDFPLQILVHSRKVNIDRYVESLVARKEDEQSPILRNQIDEYVEFIKGFVQKNAIMEKVFLVVISYYPIAGGFQSIKSPSGIFSLLGGGKPKGTKKEGVAGKEATESEEDKKTFSEHVEQIGQRTTQVVSGIQSMGLEAQILNDEQLIELLYNFYNPQTIERKNISALAEN